MKKHFRIAGQTISSRNAARPRTWKSPAGDDTTIYQVTKSGSECLFGNEDQSFRTMTAASKDKIFVWLDGRVHELQEIRRDRGRR